MWPTKGRATAVPWNLGCSTKPTCPDTGFWVLRSLPIQCAGRSHRPRQHTARSHRDSAESTAVGADSQQAPENLAPDRSTHLLLQATGRWQWLRGCESLGPAGLTVCGFAILREPGSLLATVWQQGLQQCEKVQRKTRGPRRPDATG